MNEAVIKIKSLYNQIGSQIIHENLNLEVMRGEVIGIVGGSGSGKTVLLNTILGLRQPQSGTIKVFDVDISGVNNHDSLKAHWGVLFQSGALFSSMTVGDNIKVPMREIAKTPSELQNEIVQLKLKMVGLDDSAINKLPSELSGGMIKRVALARALAIDAELLFLDEPTSGLDPISATAFDNLILDLKRNLGLTVVMITHDMDSLLNICDRIAVLVDKKIIVDKTENILKNPHPWIQEYFHGTRGNSRTRRS